MLQHGITVTYSELSGRLNGKRSSSAKSSEQGIKFCTVEPPLKGFGNLLVIILKGEQPVFEFF